MIPTSHSLQLTKSDLINPRGILNLLPKKDLIYGKATYIDPEGAGDLIYRWKCHNSSKNLPKPKDFRLINSLSVIKGMKNSHEYRQFRKDAKIMQRVNKSSTGIKNSIPNIRFGVQMKPSTPISNVLSNYYSRSPLIKTYDSLPMGNKKSKSLEKNSTYKSISTQFPNRNAEKLAQTNRVSRKGYNKQEILPKLAYRSQRILKKNSSTSRINHSKGLNIFSKL
ncbi:hypothetical protein SteCoe_29995 [Stentor coeruleus]|uniref:Uncharacterized protein n=1 Tax=Stentor coeruleus TaxID=5963 RepID=A0A1R2B4M9_9CILI|nr:hypothetical protein SteCoe_29995 [Stentor coeruleus]